MRGYQKENETAIDTIASMKREFTVKEGDFVGQIERLNGEIARLRLESERTGGDSSRHLERQLAAEASLKVQALEFAERERELTREREASRAAARAAEAKLAGVDYEAIEKVRLFNLFTCTGNWCGLTSCFLFTGCRRFAIGNRRRDNRDDDT